MKTCLEPGCPVLVEPSGRCPEHRRALEQQHSRYTRGNYGRPWRRKRERFLQQSFPWFCAIQSPRCQAPGRMLKRAEVEVDHIVPHRGDVTLRDDPMNWQIACASCHSWKTWKETHCGC